MGDFKNRKLALCWNLGLSWLLIICTPTFSLALLNTVVYSNGAFTLADDKGPVVLVTPRLFFSGTSEPVTFQGAETDKVGLLRGKLKLPAGGWVDLIGELEKTETGLKVRYEMVPNATVTIQQADVAFQYNMREWKGGNFQLGMFTVKNLGTKAGGTFRNRGQTLAVIGPSYFHNNLVLQINGDDTLASTVSKSCGGETSGFEISLDSTKRPGFVQCCSVPDATLDQVWVQGEKKSFRFEMMGNHPIGLVEKTESLKALEKARKSLFNDDKDGLNDSIRTAESGKQSVKAIMDRGAITVPKNAKSVKFYVSNVLGTHLFLPSEIKINGKTYQGYIYCDSGVRPASELELEISGEFFNQLGLKPLRTRTASNGTRVGAEGGAGERRIVNWNVITDDERSDVGKMNVTLTMGDMSYEHSILYTDEVLDTTANLMYEKHDPYLKEKKVLGVFTYAYFKKSIISIDYPGSTMYFRPLDAKQRTLSEEPPVAEIDCIFRDDGIYCPVNINDALSGYGNFDTGAPSVEFDSGRVPVTHMPIKKLLIGGYDVLNNNGSLFPAVYKNLCTEIIDGTNVLALLGNDVFKNRLITIDPVKNKIYVER